ncbi:MAG: hybrid sensor histidine kinase/response regulator [Calditrichaeota bacterium]|nr:MAG: hybrid sensor histidine kinase/response regulator [Calditrichota bacterium]
MRVLVSQSNHKFALLIEKALTEHPSRDSIQILPVDAELLQQNFSDFNLLILDDSVDILALLQQIKNQNSIQSPAIIYFYNSTNSQAGQAALHAGINYALPKIDGILDNFADLAKRAILINQNNEKVSILCRQLEEADKAAFIGRISAGLAHDFNNILHLIGGHAQAALELENTEVKNASLDIIRDCCDQGKNISDQLANLLKPKSFDYCNLPISSIIDSALHLMQYELTRSKIIVEKNYTAHLRVMCNEEQIIQMFLNLLLNACDSLHASGGKLLISVKEENETALIEFADTGPGIDENLHSKIFDPMFTTKNNEQKSPAIGGAGLGLFISKNIVQQHKGQINVKNRDGGGTIFSIALPLAKQTLPFPKTPVPEIPSGTRKNLEILVVEDEAMIRSVLNNLLTMEGHKVTLVDNGELALQKVIDYDYDLILSDLNMPNMSGLDFLKQAKGIKEDLKIVMITGDHFSEDLDEAVEAGAYSKLLKPFNKKELDEILLQVNTASD